jgi:hypothetical protein
VGKLGQLAQVPILVPFPAVQLAALIHTPSPCLEMLDVQYSERIFYLSKFVPTVIPLPDNNKPVKIRGGRAAKSQNRKFANLNICVDLQSFRKFGILRICGPYIFYLSEFFTLVLLSVSTVILLPDNKKPVKTE